MPELSTMRAALICAARAPSIHNSQPWKWRRRNGGLDLLSDDSRWAPATDPSRMDLLLSCGAALHHARIAFAALGWSTAVDRMPGSGGPAHLASLHFARAAQTSITQDVLALSAAMTKRFSNHAPYSSWEVPEGIATDLIQSGTAQGAVVVKLENQAVIEELSKASTYPQPARTTGGDGTEAPTVRTRPCSAASVVRPPVSFEPSSLDEDASLFLAVGTEHPDTESLLRAGEAASAILLEATVVGLSTCLISISAEMLHPGRLLRSAMDSRISDPCVVVRTGWAHIDQRPPEPTPRLPLNAIFQP
jgi:hypothetical protein